MLDLSGLSLVNLPSEVFKLHHLRGLNLSNNALAYIPDEIAELTGLQTLHLDRNPLEAIPVGTFALTELRMLNLVATRISTIPNEIARLRRLETLDLRLAPITTVSDHIGSLDYLQTFMLHSAKLSTFPDVLLDCIALRNLVIHEIPNLFRSGFGRAPRTLGRLVRLRQLELVGVGIVSLPDVFDRFPDLTFLILNYNQIKTLPPSMRALTELRELGLEGNNLSIPPEILGAKPQQILNYYFSTVGDGAKVSLNEAKMVVVGQGGVGKTSLVRRLLGQDIDMQETTTRGIRIMPWYDGEGADRLTVNIWDLIETSILNPGWVTAGVYQILNAHLDGGVLPLARLSKILDPGKYPPRQHLFITGMMKKFELCFEFDDPPNTFLLPDLLPKNEPDTGSWDSALRFQYHYEVLPSSVISRFIVRMHPFISHRTYWRNGVVIAKDGCRALIKADLEDRKIFVHVAGGSARRTLMDVIRSQFELIHATIPELAVQEKVPMPDNPEIVADYRNLVTMLELGETTFVPIGAKQRCEIRPLLDGIETARRREAKTDERAGYATRRAPSPAMPPKDTGAVAWLQIGLFLLLAVVVIAGSFGGIAWLVGGTNLAVVVIGTVLVLCFIGVLIALHTGRLTERNAVALIRDVLTRLRLVHAPKSG
jgi:Leucine-rich repeat (LRR) protein